MARPNAAPDALFDSRDLLLYVLVDQNGSATCGGTTTDWAWVASSLRALADRYQSRADSSRVGA